MMRATYELSVLTRYAAAVGVSLATLASAVAAPAPGRTPARESDLAPATPAAFHDVLAKKEKDDPKLPGGEWDLRDLEKAFRVVKTTHQDDKVVFLVEKLADGYVSFEVNFYDEDQVKLAYTNITFDPASPAKG